MTRAFFGAFGSFADADTVIDASMLSAVTRIVTAPLPGGLATRVEDERPGTATWKAALCGHLSCVSSP